jgi:hypothetical protein
MALLVVQHPVSDYDTWRKVYDEVAPLQESSGVTSQSVYRSKDDPNLVLVLHSFPTMDQATAFLENSELEAAMKRAGVAGPPRSEFYEEA